MSNDLRPALEALLKPGSASCVEITAAASSHIVNKIWAALLPRNATSSVFTRDPASVKYAWQAQGEI